MADLSLADLERYDPTAPSARGVERKFCCPLPGLCAEKKIDAAHRKLYVNTGSGAWICHRCGESGKLKEWWVQTARPRDMFSPPTVMRPPTREDEIALVKAVDEDITAMWKMVDEMRMDGVDVGDLPAALAGLDFSREGPYE